MGYDAFDHVTREYAVHGVGNTEHCDFAIQIDRKESSTPDVIVEIKRVNVDLVPKHIKQAASYAINLGCEWALLTNGKEWRLYHISFTQPPQTKLLESWNLMEDDPTTLTNKFDLICYKTIRKGGLIQLWDKSNVLTPHNLLKEILSEDSLSLIRRKLKKATDVAVSPEEIVGAFRHLLNDGAIAEMEKIRICLPEQKRKDASKRIKAKATTQPIK